MSPAGGETMVKPTVIQALNVIYKKIRNLEKRRAKLDLLRGAKKELDLEQQKALTKYDEVILLLENYKESRDQVNKIIAEEAKNKIKQEKMEKEEKLKADISKVSFVLSVNRLFDLILSSDGQELVKEAAPQLNGKPLELLLEFAELVMSGISSGDELQMNEVLEHLVYLADNKNKRSAKYLYKALRESVDILLDSGLLASQTQTSLDEANQEEDNEEVEETQEAVEESGQALESAQAPEATRPTQQNMRPVNGHAIEDDNEAALRLGHHTAVPAESMPQAAAGPMPTFPAKENSLPPQISAAPVAAQQPAVPVPRAEKQPTPEPSFNFLQESQIDLDSPLMNDPAVVMVQGGRKPDQGFPPPPVFNSLSNHNHSMNSLSQQLLQQHMMAAHQHQLQQQGQLLQQQAGQPQPQQQQAPAATQQHQNYIQQQQEQPQQTVAQPQNAEQAPQEQRAPRPQQVPRVPQPGTVTYSSQQQPQQHDNSRFNQDSVRYDRTTEEAEPNSHNNQQPQQQQHGYNSFQQYQNGGDDAGEIGTWGEEGGQSGKSEGHSDDRGSNDRRRDDRGRGGRGGGRGYSGGRGGGEGRGGGGGRGYSRGRGGGGDRGGYRGGRGGGEGGRDNRDFRGGEHRDSFRGNNGGEYNNRGGDYNKRGGDREYNRGGEYRGGDRSRGNRGYAGGNGGRGRGGPRGGSGGPRGAPGSHRE